MKLAEINKQKKKSLKTKLLLTLQFCEYVFCFAVVAVIFTLVASVKCYFRHSQLPSFTPPFPRWALIKNSEGKDNLEINTKLISVSQTELSNLTGQQHTTLNGQE